MQILLGDNNRIMGYATVGGFVGGVDVEFGPETMPDFAPGKYLLQNGVPVQNPDYVPPAEPDPEEPGRDPLTILQETVDMLVITTPGGGSDV